MKMTIKQITLENFKGVKNKTYDLSAKTTISGANGVGKTSIADAHNWLWFDKNYNCKSNPAIRTEGEEELTPVVTEVLDIDGKTITVAKSQAMTTKGAKVSLTNSYTINAVPKNESAFKEYMSELGIDFDKMFTLSHPEAFMAEDKKVQRAILFGLASEKTDLDIAKSIDETSEIVSLLNDYTIDEIKAMQNQTLRKITENYGKKGEILRAKIEGLLTAKVNIDVAEIELQKNALAEEIKSLREQADTYKSQMISTEVQDNKINSVNSEIEAAELKVEILKKSANQISNDLTKAQMDLTRATNEWHEIINSKFDENSVVCPTCGQEYSEEKKESIRKSYELNLHKQKERITEDGKRAKKLVTELTIKVSEYKEKVAESEKTLKDLIAKKGAIMQTFADEKSKNKALSEKYLICGDAIREKNSVIAQLDMKIGSISNNDRIDAEVEVLKKDQERYEAERAKAECILAQLEDLSKKKNEELVNEVNEHFNIAKFVLFMVQKNGEVKDDCRLTVDSFEVGKSANRGRELLAKLDVISGLKKFYGQSYPVFLDNAESLSESTTGRINTDYQLIKMVVTEEPEIVVKGE